MISLREASRELIRIAGDIRDVAGRVDGVEPTRWAAARDLRSTAANLEAHAAIAEREGIRAGEPDPESPEALLAIHAQLDAQANAARNWPVDHEFGE